MLKLPALLFLLYSSFFTLNAAQENLCSEDFEGFELSFSLIEDPDERNPIRILTILASSTDADKAYHFVQALYEFRQLSEKLCGSDEKLKQWIKDLHLIDNCTHPISLKNLLEAGAIPTSNCLKVNLNLASPHPDFFTLLLSYNYTPTQEDLEYATELADREPLSEDLNDPIGEQAREIRSKVREQIAQKLQEGRS